MRMIDRWFPCAEVSDASYQAYGSGNTEKSLFTWFAARPVAQARAAVLTTLLPWPEEKAEQRRLQDLVRRAIAGDPGALQDAADEIRQSNPDGVRILYPFAGRAIIPLEAARARVEAWGLDYSPVATLGGMLLAEAMFKNWNGEPGLPFGPHYQDEHVFRGVNRLAHDVAALFAEIGDRFEQVMDAFYPKNPQGERPWGYLWAQTMPCDECRYRFPLVGTTVLRLPNPAKDNPGASFAFVADRSSGTLQVILQDGVTPHTPTLLAMGAKGKAARCPFCQHPHDPDGIKVKAKSGQMRDRLLLVADLVPRKGPVFRLPTPAEFGAIEQAETALAAEPLFRAGVPAVPDEPIPPRQDNKPIEAILYGVDTFGRMCGARQTLGFVRLCRIIADLQPELQQAGCSEDYVRALLGYAGAVIVRKLRRSTRGATLDPSRNGLHDIFKNQACLAYSLDFLEAGIGGGSGTWRSLSDDTLQVITKLSRQTGAVAARIRQGNALQLPFRPRSLTAVITDPPYGELIAYADASDLFFVWLKRALGATYPELFDVTGVQDKTSEIIVKRGYSSTPGEHRTPAFYQRSLHTAFANIRKVLKEEGSLTLVFGHSDPDAWHLLLAALTEARFVITGSWPARTEASSGADAANIRVTITIACRSAPAQRPDGLQTAVDLAVDREIRSRIADWERDGLALADQLMASYGPAMEVLGRYERVLRHDGTQVDLERYLALARQTVQDAAAIKIDGIPLETFDSRTAFALFWVRLYGRQFAAKSEARFQAQAAHLRLEDVRRGILEAHTKGYRFAEFGERAPDDPTIVISTESALIDIVREMVRAWRAAGGEGVATVLAQAERAAEDTHLWAVITDLANTLPPADRDRKALDDLLRNRRAIGVARISLERAAPGNGHLQLSMFDGVDSARRPGRRREQRLPREVGG